MPLGNAVGTSFILCTAISTSPFIIATSNVFVKIPVTYTSGESTLSVIKTLVEEEIKLNITAVYTITQVRKIIRNVNKNSRIIISIFAGRMGDSGKDPIPIIKQSVLLTKKKKKLISRKR